MWLLILWVWVMRPPIEVKVVVRIDFNDFYLCRLREDFLELWKIRVVLDFIDLRPFEFVVEFEFEFLWLLLRYFLFLFLLNRSLIRLVLILSCLENLVRRLNHRFFEWNIINGLCVALVLLLKPKANLLPVRVSILLTKHRSPISLNSLNRIKNLRIVKFCFINNMISLIMNSRNRNIRIELFALSFGWWNKLSLVLVMGLLLKVIYHCHSWR